MFMSDLPIPLSFEWDEGNQEKNWKLHKVHFRECEQIFFDEEVKFFQDEKHSQTEDRFLAYGQTEAGRKLIVVFTIRNSKIRVISARDQNRKERKI